MRALLPSSLPTARGWRREQRRELQTRFPRAGPRVRLVRNRHHQNPGSNARIPHAIYGYVSPASKGNPPERVLDVRPALTWKTAVAGHHRFTGRRAGGLRRHLPNAAPNADRRARSRLCGWNSAPALDLTTIDITHCPELKVGDPVMILGTEGNVTIDAQQIARTAGTISYSVLCEISARVKRM